MSEAKSLNDVAWEALFDKYDILNRIDMNGSFRISAAQIREYREPRLMAKFDHTVNLPGIFSILPVTRGDYEISGFDAYHKFETPSPGLVRMSVPTHIESLDSENISSEAVALNCAAASGILRHFTEEEQLFPTVSGRMSSGVFDFKIMNLRTKKYLDMNVTNSQIEIDAAYEGSSCLALFEAKRDLSEDFLIRQLYYPYRTWQSRIKKEVKPVFLIYSNGIYRLYQYRFEDPYDYSSISLVRQQNYTIEDTAITAEEIREILCRTEYIAEPEISFPQADKFERVINLCELLCDSDMTKGTITEKYAFNPRQTDYYTNAAVYLGLADKTRLSGGGFLVRLSSMGRDILRKKYKQRQLEFCTLILRHRVFAKTLEMYFAKNTMPSADEIIGIMKQSVLYRVESEATYKRRASTVRGWTDWITGLINTK